MIAELHPALLQAAVLSGTAGLCWYLYSRYRRPEVFWWSVAWTLYVFRIGAIVAFLATDATNYTWLFIHQVFTGYTALALLWAALRFIGERRYATAFKLALLFPLVWSYVAIYQLDSFLLASLPAVLFLSFATLWTGVVFLRQWRRTGSRGAAVLGAVLVTWALHHLDYPILRAQGAWTPWGPYLDILFVLAVGIGIVMVVLEQLDRRTRDLERLSARAIRQHEDERRHVALELHDQTAQVWAAVKLQLGLVREGATDAVAPRIDRVLALVDTGITSIRGVTTNLRPPLLDDLGLVAALRALVQTFAEQTGMTISFEAPDQLPELSDDASLALYRALQEALSNVARHSGATKTSVQIDTRGGEVRMVVTDNGAGFRAGENAEGFGITGMRERIAALRGAIMFDSAPAGTSVTVRIPVTH